LRGKKEGFWLYWGENGLQPSYFRLAFSGFVLSFFRVVLGEVGYASH
jgi:hypothetical protein